MITHRAACVGQLHALQWCLARGCEWDKARICEWAAMGGSIEVLFPAEGDALYSASYETVRWNRPAGAGGGGGSTVAVELFRGASPCAAEPAPTPAPHHATPPVAPVLPERVAVLTTAAPDTGYARSPARSLATD